MAPYWSAERGAYNIGQGLTPEGLDAVAHIATFFKTHLA